MPSSRSLCAAGLLTIGLLTGTTIAQEQQPDPTAALVRHAEPIAQATLPKEWRAAAPDTPPAVEHTTLRAAGEAAEDVELWMDFARRIDPLAVEFGLPARTDIDALRVTAAHVVVTADRARRAIETVVDDIDRQRNAGAATPNDSDVREAILRAEVVLPLRIVRASLWLAATERDVRAQRDLAEAAARMAADIDPVSDWAEMERGLLLAHALLLNGHTETVPGILDGASRMLAGTPQLRNPALDFDERIALLRLKTVQRIDGTAAARRALLEATKREPFVNPAGIHDWRLLLLTIDVNHRMDLDDRPNEQTRISAGSIRSYGDLIDRRDTSNPDPDRRRADVFRRIVQTMDPVIEARGPEAALSDLPTFAGTALGRALHDAGEHDDAMQVLQATRERMSGWDDPAAPDVLFELGRAQTSGDSPHDLLAGARTLVEMAQAAPDNDRASRAATIAATAARAAMDDPDLLAPVADVELEALRLIHAMPQDVARRDQWRLLLVARLIPRLGTSDGPARLREASTVLDAVRSPDVAETAARTAVALWSAALRQAQRDAARWTAAGFASDDIARRLLVACDASPSTLARCDALLELDRPADVIEMLAGRGDLTIELLDCRAHAEARLGQVEALRSTLTAITSRDPASQTSRNIARAAWAEIDSSAGGFPPDEPIITALPSAQVLHTCAAFTESTDIVRRQAAEALLLAGKPDEALALLGPLPASADVMILRAEAHRAAGTLEQAFAQFRSVAVDASEDSEQYWHAWARMLEILSAQDSSAERTTVIRREIRRLQGLDGAETFSEALRRIDAVAASLRE
ncbi:MAG: hypothetical protein AAFX05_10970 [Planctomycetota bacterium]